LRKNVPVKHLIFRQAFGARGDDVLLPDFIEEGVLGQEGHLP